MLSKYVLSSYSIVLQSQIDKVTFVKKAVNTKGIFLGQISRGLYKMPGCGTQVTEKELDRPKGNSVCDGQTQTRGKDPDGGSGDSDGGIPNRGSGGSLALKVGLGVGATVTVGTLLVANVILPGIGFAAGGVLANSWAAGMMSSAAIANGGSIAAGSGIAIAQSIGATGVSLATGAAAGAGAGTVSGALAQVGETLFRMAKGKKNKSKNDKQTQTDDSDDEPEQ